MRAARRMTVSPAPTATTQSAIVRISSSPLHSGSSVATRAAAVISAIRWGFAIGPEKSAGNPHVRPNSRV